MDLCSFKVPQQLPPQLGARFWALVEGGNGQGRAGQRAVGEAQAQGTQADFDLSCLPAEDRTKDARGEPAEALGPRESVPALLAPRGSRGRPAV